MIDINELRRLAQAVSVCGDCNQTWLDQWEDPPAVVVGHIGEDGETYPVVTIDCDQYYAADQSLPLGKFYAAANPTTINELLDRLEAAEKDVALKERIIDSLGSELNAVANERDALRAAVQHEADCVEAAKAEIVTLRTRIETMEKQEPVAWMLNCPTLGGDTGWILSWTQSGAGLCNRLSGEENEKKLYALPGAQPAPSLASGDVSLISEGKTQPAPSVPEGWLRAIDEALVVAHVGVANESDTYEQAREKLNNLIGWHTDVATDPVVNGGYKLVPIEPTPEMVDAIEEQWMCGSATGMARREYLAALAAAPEAKP